MKKIKIVFSLALCLVGGSLLAQPQQKRQNTDEHRERMDDKRENIESMKIGFITNKLSLTPDEAKRFWPVYNTYSDEIKKLRTDRRERMRDAREGFDKMVDKDVEKLIDGEMAFKQQELDVMKKYHSQFKEVLPMKKVALLYRAEEDFKRELIEKIKERKPDQDHDGGRQ